MASKRIYDSIVKREPIIKGFSGDRKYCVKGSDGAQYLLRISPIEKYDAYKNLFEILERCDALGVPMCKPIELGICPDGVYSLFSWIFGEDLCDALPKLPEAEQYDLGVESGKILKIIHSIPAPENQEEWAVKFGRSIDAKIKRYWESDTAKFDGGDYLINYVEQNRELLRNRLQCFRHGDYSVPNMMLENGELQIIDFDRLSYGDPWEEFFKIVFSAQISGYFSTGQLHGYFDGEPPLEFFKLLAFYTAGRSILAIEWAIPFGHEEVEFVKNLLANILSWHDNMNNPVPSWYLSKYR